MCQRLTILTEVVRRAPRSRHTDVGTAHHVTSSSVKSVVLLVHGTQMLERHVMLLQVQSSPSCSSFTAHKCWNGTSRYFKFSQVRRASRSRHTDVGTAHHVISCAVLSNNPNMVCMLGMLQYIGVENEPKILHQNKNCLQIAGRLRVFWAD
jgi:cation transport regulator ChaB